VNFTTALILVAGARRRSFDAHRTTSEFAVAYPPGWTSSPFQEQNESRSPYSYASLEKYAFVDLR